MKNLILLLISLFMITPIQKPKRIVFFGDSITEMGTQTNGYISLLKAKANAQVFEFIGAGIGGDKVYDLYLRLENDVLKHQPDIVFIYVGINDVWHKSDFGTGTDLDKFEKFYRAIIRKIQAQGAQVICVTPTFIGEKWDASNPQDGDLNAYAKTIKKIAKSTESGLVDLRTIFLEYSRTHNPENLEKGILTTDRVHLNETGNQLVAEAFLEALQNHK
ncbi:MAG: SGNH/GDSL hydrolase family protein [Bacteroidetes bacterium]|nr:SGNH/GDSL hydrolase family protein [Bacteroidota bacterium]